MKENVEAETERNEDFPTAGGEIDIWRDTKLRYLGYANEVGESFRPIAPKMVVPSYVVAFGYVFGDTLNCSLNAHKETKAWPDRMQASKYIGGKAIDCLLWQSLASVMIPGLVINRAVYATSKLLDRVPRKVPSVLRRWAPTALGLAVVPLIVHPIDSAVHKAMDHTIRPATASWTNSPLPPSDSPVQDE